MLTINLNWAVHGPQSHPFWAGSIGAAEGAGRKVAAIGAGRHYQAPPARRLLALDDVIEANSAME